MPNNQCLDEIQSSYGLWIGRRAYFRGNTVSKISLKWIGILSAAAVAAAMPPAAAQMTSNNALAGARALSFLQPALSGPVTAAIIYRPGDAASEAEAQAIERALEGGLTVGPFTLKPRKVAAGALAGLAGAKVAFVTRDASERSVASAAAQRSIVTISSDPDCARQGLCVLSISPGSKVQIIVSKAACNAAKVKFGAAFLMLVKEI